MITGRKVRLRAPERSDAAKLWQWLNDEEAMYYWAAPGSTVSLAQVERVLEADLAALPELSSVDPVGPWGRRYIIETLDGLAIGQIGYSPDTLPRHGVADIGIIIGEKDYWDKGYGTDAMMTLLDHLFNEQRLHRVSLRVEEYNERAIVCYEKCGFVREGLLREQRFIHGKRTNAIVMGILRDEFDQRYQEYVAAAEPALADLP
ncbi:MAG: GNAT family protein [Chloroflexota bacterium]|nr:GNAT family protein [Chloroflexota bacterium]